MQQLRDRLRDLILESESNTTGQSAPDNNTVNKPICNPPHFFSPVTGGNNEKSHEIFHAGCPPGALFSSLDPSGKYPPSNVIPLSDDAPEKLPAPEEPANDRENSAVHLDPDMVWINDSLFENLRSRLYPKDPVKETETPSWHFSGNEHRPENAGNWDLLIRSSDDMRYPVFAIDRSRKVIVWNTAIEKLTGIPRQEMIGKGDHAYSVPFFGTPHEMLIDYVIIPPEIARILKPVPALQEGETFIGDVEEALINGNPVQMWSRASRICDDAGKVIAAVQSIGIAHKELPAVSDHDGTIGKKQGELHTAFEKLALTQEELLGNYRDLTQVQQQLIENEQKFRAREAFLKSVISDAREGIVAYDRDLKYILWNRFMENITGLPATEVIGKGAVEMVPRLKLPGADHLLERAIAGETVESSDFSLIIAKSGKQMWVNVIYSPLTDSGGTIFGVIGIVQDTTARKVIEYALQTTIVQLVESESKYRNVFNAKNDPLLLIEPGSRRILDLNDVAAGMYGYSREEMLELALPDLYAEPGETGQESPLPVSQVWTGHHRKKDGTLFPVDVSSAYADVKGDSVLILSVRDLSSVQRIADSLRLANAKLNLLMGITRHDVLNNLTAVMGYNSLLKKDISDPGCIEMLDRQETSLKSIRHQIEFTREYDELGVKSPRWQNVSEIATRSYSQFMNTASFTCDTGELEIYADPMLERVFYNLFDNSFRYGQGLSKIRITCKQQDSDLCLFFEDDGPGVSDEDKERIFIRGYGKHTGLGLFLVREILAITRIEILETGEYRKGARFEFRIPKGSYRFPNPARPGSDAEQDKKRIPTGTSLTENPVVPVSPAEKKGTLVSRNMDLFMRQTGSGIPVGQDNKQIRTDPALLKNPALLGSPAEKNMTTISEDTDHFTSPDGSGSPFEEDETSLPFFLNKLRPKSPEKNRD